MFLDEKETNTFLQTVTAEIVKSENAGGTGDEKENRAIEEITKYRKPESHFSTLHSMVGGSKWLPLVSFAVKALVFVLNETLGHGWLNQILNRNKTDK